MTVMNRETERKTTHKKEEWTLTMSSQQNTHRKFKDSRNVSSDVSPSLPVRVPVKLLGSRSGKVCTHAPSSKHTVRPILIDVITDPLHSVADHTGQAPGAFAMSSSRSSNHARTDCVYAIRIISASSITSHAVQFAGYPFRRPWSSRPLQGTSRQRCISFSTGPGKVDETDELRPRSMGHKRGACPLPENGSLHNCRRTLVSTSFASERLK